MYERKGYVSNGSCAVAGVSSLIRGRAAEGGFTFALNLGA